MRRVSQRSKPSCVCWKVSASPAADGMTLAEGTAKPPVRAALRYASAAYFRLKNAFMPGYSATSPRRRKVRSAPFPPAPKTPPAPFPAPLPTVRGTAGPPGTELGDTKQQSRPDGRRCAMLRCLLQIEERLHAGIFCHVASSPQSPLRAVSACAENSARSPFRLLSPPCGARRGPLVWSWATRNSKDRPSGRLCAILRCLLQIEERLHAGILCHVASSPQSPLRAVSACGENSARSLSGSSPHRAGHGGAPWYGAGRRRKSRTAEAVLPAFREVLTSD